jgi:hypothetical protein
MNGRGYQCVVTANGSCGTATSNFQLLQVIALTKPVIIANLSNPESTVLSTNFGGNHQWFKNGTTISGATNASYTVTSEGSYTVQTLSNGCTSVLSDPVAIIVTGDVDARALSSIDVYPNPGSDHVTLSLGGFEKDKPVSISIVDMQGRVMEKTSGLGQREISIDIRNYTSGKYIAWLQQRTTKVARQFIKTDK